ncbi:MAG TPA: LD-carboxypeptidase [Salinivirgaceae bacterium]|nr:LD-carboxypeptidase [Salinivirgaceae bacterium]
MNEVNIKTLITPPSLNAGDRVRIVSPSRSITLEEILPAAEWLRQHGFRVEYGKTIGKIDGQFAGSDEERANDFQDALHDDGVRAIWCARGGYGAARILTKIDFSILRQSPKWIIGFSDITAIHAAVYLQNIISMHAPMPINFKNSIETSISLGLMLTILRGKTMPLEWDSSPFNRPGIATGRVWGGNLSVIYSLRGTPYDIDINETILMLEDIDEYLYHIDRMINNLQLGGNFNPKAMIVGQFTDMHDNTIPFGKNAYEIVSEYTKSQTLKAATFNAPFGHVDYNLPLLIGAEATLNVGTKRTTLMYHVGTF